MGRVRIIKEIETNKLSDSFQEFLIFKQAQGISAETIK